MHISFVVKKVFDYMYRRKLNFFLTIIVSLVTVYLLAMVLTMLANSYYYIYMAKNTIKDTDYLNIKILSVLINNEYYDSIEMFDEELTDIYGDDYGKFMKMDVNYSDAVEPVKVMYIDSAIMDLCELNVDDKIDQTDGADIAAYVGYNLKDQYPVGTIIENLYTGSKTQIVGILGKDSTWIPDLLFYSEDAVELLDDMIVSEIDSGYYELSKGFYGNFFNSIYIECKTAKEAEEARLTVKEAADKYGVMVYINTIDELIEAEKEENKDLFDALGILFVFVVVIAVLAYITSNAADIYSRQYEFGIMYINGVSSIEIYMMIWLENIIKLMISLGISVCLYIRSLDVTEIYVFSHMVIPVLAAALLVFSFVLSGILYLTIKKKDILTLIGGVRL